MFRCTAVYTQITSVLMQLDKSPNVPLSAGSDLLGLVFSPDRLHGRKPKGLVCKSNLHPTVSIVMFGIITG